MGIGFGRPLKDLQPAPVSRREALAQPTDEECHSEARLGRAEESLLRETFKKEGFFVARLRGLLRMTH